MMNLSLKYFIDLQIIYFYLLKSMLEKNPITRI